MLKQPLFGEDSSPQKTSLLLSAIITLCAWIIFCLMAFFIKFKPQTPEYKEVQIVLASTPVEEKQEEESASASSASESASFEEQTAVTEPVEVPEISDPVETPVAQAKAEAPKQQAAPAKAQTQPAKSQTQPVKTTTTPPKTTEPSKKVNFDDYQYGTDLSDIDFNNNSKSSSSKSFDWSQFDDSDSAPEPQVSQQVKTVTTQSSTSGSAASTSTANQRQSSQNSTNTYPSPSSSSDVDSKLNAIRNTTGSSSGSSNNNSDLNQQFSSDLDMTWNGGARKQNGKLSINLDSVSSYISEKKTTVGIEFTVDEKGYVIAGTIKIDRESLLNKNVRDEIISQIGKWRFTEASYRSTATFEYTILKQ